MTLIGFVQLTFVQTQSSIQKWPFMTDLAP